MTNGKVCFICGSPAPEISRESNTDCYCVRCLVCGEYVITHEAAEFQQWNYPHERACVSAFIRERMVREAEPHFLFLNETEAEKLRPTRFTISINRILKEHPLGSIAERLDRTVLNFSYLSKYPGYEFKFKDTDYPLTYAENSDASLFLLKQLASDELIEPFHILPGMVRLTSNGWNRIAELERGHLGRENRQVFVAMSFAPEMDKVWEDGFRPGIKDAGFEAFRVDMCERNEKICDVIISEIRRSKFLVADFTLHRQGVYFEAGMMLGLGRPVIYTCRKDELDKAHFDTRQYNHISWETPEELRLKLKRRIEATIII
ncbi:MAG: hypothetical protein HY707_06945 [Ignavibacteriae bacterium]|nr:hypothetical protein [Ignavibacteriota bacterium]